MIKLKLSRREKRNNKGMTLVEVMVAITILSIVSIAFLKSFSTAAMVNRNAKKKQNALIAAESMMEVFKAYDMENVNLQFSPATSDADFKFADLSAGGTKSIVTDYNHYLISGMQGTAGRYDVDITVFGSTAGVAKPSVASMSTMDRVGVNSVAYDAIFEQSLDEQIELRRAVYNKLCNIPNVDTSAGGFPANEYGVDENKVTITSRQVTVDINSNTVEVSVDYAYSINGYDYVKLSGAAGSYSATGTLTINSSTPGFSSYLAFDGSTSGAAYEDVYLYVYPAYAYSSSGWIKCDYSRDTVSIINHTANQKAVYLLKQNNNTYFSTATLGIAEGSYVGNVSCTGNVALYHNMNSDLNGGTSGAVNVTGATEESTDLWEKDVDKSLVYDINIKVYDADATGSDPLVDLNGSANTK